MTEVLRLTPAEIRARDTETEIEAARTPDRLKPGAQSVNGTAVAGLRGQFFIGEGSNRWEIHYLGRVDIEPPWFNAWKRLLDRRQAEARTRGVELWNLIIPEKQVVLPELRWSAPLPPADKRPFAQLLPHIAPEHRLYYGLESLEAAKPDGPVFFVRNSHWCPTGCLAGIRGLVEAMGVTVDFAGLQFAYEMVRGTHDLPLHFFENPFKVDAGLLRANGEYTFENHTLPTTGRYVGSSYGIRNPDAPDPRRVVIFGDSFSYDAGVAFTLSAVFRDVSFFWTKNVEWKVVEAQRADLVIWESAERFMVTLPES